MVLSELVGGTKRDVEKVVPHHDVLCSGEHSSSCSTADKIIKNNIIIINY